MKDFDLFVNTTTQRILKKKNLFTKTTVSALYKPIQGENLLRILPWETPVEELPSHIKNMYTLRGEEGEILAGEDGKPIIYIPPMLYYKVHTVEGIQLTCANSFGDRCPVCNMGYNLWNKFVKGGKQDKGLKEYAQMFFSKERFLCFVIPVLNEADLLEEKKIKPFSFGRQIYGGILTKMGERDRKTGELKYGDVSHRSTGKILGFTKTGSGMYDTEYTGFFIIDEITSVLPDNIKAPNLYQYLLDTFPYTEEKGKELIRILTGKSAEEELILEEGIPFPKQGTSINATQVDTISSTEDVTETIKRQLEKQVEADQLSSPSVGNISIEEIQKRLDEMKSSPKAVDFDDIPF